MEREKVGEIIRTVGEVAVIALMSFVMYVALSSFRRLLSPSSMQVYIVCHGTEERSITGPKKRVQKEMENILQDETCIVRSLHTR